MPLQRIDNIWDFLLKARKLPPSEGVMTYEEQHATLDLIERHEGDLASFQKEATMDQVGALYYMMGLIAS